MEAEYKGYKIEVWRDKCLGGWDLLYYVITRLSDGYMPVDSFEDSAETVRDKIKQLKERIDNEHKEDDPWMEKAESERFAN